MFGNVCVFDVGWIFSKEPDSMCSQKSGVRLVRMCYETEGKCVK